MASGMLPRLLAWPRGGEVLAMSGDGTLEGAPTMGDRGATGEPLQAQPTAFTAEGEVLHVADAERRIFRSEDGRSWTVRAPP